MVPGYPSERYLDINDAAVVRVIEARIAMCASKGFDAVEPDIDDSYTEGTGFRHLDGPERDVRHDPGRLRPRSGTGLGTEERGRPELRGLDGAGRRLRPRRAVPPVRHLRLVRPFASAGKAVLEVEYTETTSQFCPAANAANQDAMAMDVSLSGGRQPCR